MLSLKVKKFGFAKDSWFPYSAKRVSPPLPARAGLSPTVPKNSTRPTTECLPLNISHATRYRLHLSASTCKSHCERKINCIIRTTGRDCNKEMHGIIIEMHCGYLLASMSRCMAKSRNWGAAITTIGLTLGVYLGRDSLFGMEYPGTYLNRLHGCGPRSCGRHYST